MEWKTWFNHGDGTPRVIYLPIRGDTELILSDLENPDDCELKIKLEANFIRHERRFTYARPGRVADDTVRQWAVKTAEAYLSDLANEAGKIAAELEAFLKETNPPSDKKEN